MLQQIGSPRLEGQTDNKICLAYLGQAVPDLNRSAAGEQPLGRQAADWQSSQITFLRAANPKD